ncbi:MAG: GPR endopeptidase [Peptococcaceae bacterium]|nr:GPR endopeptidase [Peptococcaceae bacterium]
MPKYIFKQNPEPFSLGKPSWDLAIEAHEFLQGSHEGEIPGVSLEKFPFPQGMTSVIKVLDQQGAGIIGKPLGTYITIEAPELMDSDRRDHQDIVLALCEALKKILPQQEDYSILVAGLGNPRSTPDALGPMVTSRLMATRHLYSFNDPNLVNGLRSLAISTPGVTGITGLETAEVLEGLVRQLKPDVLLCVDALAAGDLGRLHNTIQLADSGIHPGSGIGNMRKEINQTTLGIPVLAIGVPTVVQAGIIANKALSLLADGLKQPTGKGTFPYMVSQEQKEQVINQILEPFGGSLMVTPKEVDEQVDHTAQIIAKAITLAVHPGIKPEDVECFLH